MKVSRSICNAAASGILMLVLAAPTASFAHDETCSPEQHRLMSMEGRAMMSPEGRAQWARNQLDKEAAWLEIKASQESAWEAFSAANMELVSRLGERKPMAPDVDAAAAIRQHAEHAAAFAQSLSRLAEATEKLQSVLNEDQRKILDRIVRLHSRFQGGHFPEGKADREHWHHGSEASPNASKPAPKATVPAKPKN